MKLSRLLLVTWTVTLVLFVHNVFPSTRVLYGLPGFTRALVYAGVATLLITIHTINQERRGNEPGRTTPWMAVAGGWVAVDGGDGGMPPCLRDQRELLGADRGASCLAG